MGMSLSVVVVSDHDDNGSSPWGTVRGMLGALEQQDFSEPFEVVLVKNERHRDSAPADLASLCPNMTVVYSPEVRSTKLKDLGAGQASADLVAVIDADCLPEPGWLRIVTDVLRRRPEVSAVSGRTHYGRETSYLRALSLVDRSFDDLGEAGFTTEVSTNAALYRRSLLTQFPYPHAVTPFHSAVLRMQAMSRAGIRLFFEPAAVVRHSPGGFRFMQDFRRNLGYADMSCHPARRLRSIPHIVWERSQREVHDCLRLGPRYLRWYDWPLTALLLATVPLLQIPGMLDAWRGVDEIPHTSFR